MYREPIEWDMKYKFKQNMRNIEIRNVMIDFLNNYIPSDDDDYLDKWRYKDFTKFMESFNNDERKVTRLVEHQCKTCFYTVRMSLQSFTDTECGVCGFGISHYNSDTPIICRVCAVHENICVRCGGDID